MTRRVCRRKNEAGQAALLVVLAMSIFLLGALGLAFDASQLYAHRQMAQAAADAAAEGGILSIFHGTNATGSNQFATGTTPTPFTCTTSDGRTPCAYARLNQFGGTAGDTVSVTFPTSVPGVTLATANVAAITVNVSRSVNTTLIRFFGPSAFTVGATATAALVKLPLANCITALDTSAAGAVSLSGNVTLNIPTCGIAVDSGNGSAFSANGNVTVQASAIQVVGGASQVGNVSINPTPTTGVSYMTDPLASVPSPSYNPAACDYTNYSAKKTATLTPGTYCGGISLSGNVTATFSAGTYILLGGGLNASGNVTLSGSNLTFYNTYSATYPYGAISLGGNITANLSATTSGSLAGMLFFQDRSAPLGGSQSFTGNSGMTLVGALYFPRSNLSYAGNSSSGTQNIAIVADQVSFTGNASLQINPTQAGAAQQTLVALVQ